MGLLKLPMNQWLVQYERFLSRKDTIQVSMFWYLMAVLEVSIFAG